MTFMGSKRKYAKDIVPIINNFIKKNNITTFIDCTCGGANLVDKIICDNLIGIDLSPSLIGLHIQAQSDFSLIPTDGNREMWDNSYKSWKIMKNILNNKKINDFNEDDFKEIGLPFYQIGCMEWYGSFSNRGFSGGYAKTTPTRNPYKEAWRNHKAQSENENYKKIKFICGDYADIIEQLNIENVLLYIDPPYKNTKPYDIDKKFNYERFYSWLKDISQKYPIFVSEQTLPIEFEQYKIWEKEAKRTNGTSNNFKAKETLWLIQNK